jgi:hypothetical protein
VDGIAAPVLARPDGSDFDGALDALQFALDKPPTIGYTRSVWQGAENRRERGPLGRLVLRPEIGWTLVNCHAAAGRLPSRGRTAKEEFFCTSNAGMSMKTKDRCGKVGGKRECL